MPFGVPRRLTFLRQRPVAQGQHPAGTRGEFGVVGDNDEAGASVDVEHQVKHFAGGLAVEVAGGFVGKDASGLRDQRAGDGSYAVSSGIGATKHYTVTVSEKLATDSITIQALDAGGSVANSAGNSTRLAVQATIGNMAPTANAVMVDWLFSDNSGNGPMTKSNDDGSYPPYPLAAADITNPLYAATGTCYTPSAIPNCYDPIHSHWAIACG
jgi:hypothetical protein